MAAEYKLVRNPNPHHDNRVLPLHARLVSGGTVSVDDIMRDLKARSSFSPADIKGMLQLLQDIMADYLMFGKNVELDGIGTFSVSLQCRPVMNKKEIRAESVHFRSINYRPSVKLCRRLETMPVFRADSSKQIRHYTLDECREHLLRYLNNHTFITRKTYMQLNARSKPQACMDLKQFLNEGIINRYGQGPTTFYMKRPSGDE
ncbi:HU family DNA-binding protein [Parabacteroides sp. PF5-9]|uniref:HU family DNA-binding protein n=1 Tax=Parabacteroides sp. PF5-9 TaxID=1742404 RepID=UPI002474A183|nr:HU family DNA-binding protein [Parabacteroides sp. PF5-9]MDH6359275.1 putative histone-like DNA-binding protein [Parabacteroides sp. PF5-9]